MPPMSRGSPTGASGRISIPPAKGGRGAAAAKGAAAGGAGAALLAAQQQPGAPGEEEDSEEEEEDEESEEAQMCWSAVFSCFPLLWTIAAEFATAAYEAVGYLSNFALESSARVPQARSSDFSSSFVLLSSYASGRS